MKKSKGNISDTFLVAFGFIGLLLALATVRAVAAPASTLPEGFIRACPEGSYYAENPTTHQSICVVDTVATSNAAWVAALDTMAMIADSIANPDSVKAYQDSVHSARILHLKKMKKIAKARGFTLKRGSQQFHDAYALMMDSTLHFLEKKMENTVQEVANLSGHNTPSDAFLQEDSQTLTNKYFK